jgi:SET domain-containing protein
MKIIVCNGYPRLCLFALRDIDAGEELRYDYGDDPANLFWRHQVRKENYTLRLLFEAIDL